MYQLGRVVTKKKTRVLKASGGQCKWAETFHFHLAALDNACSLSVKLYSRSSVRRKQCLGQVSFWLLLGGTCKYLYSDLKMTED